MCEWNLFHLSWEEEIKERKIIGKGKREDQMLVWQNRSIWLSKALIGKLTLLRVLRASCAARRAGSAFAKSSSQSFCFPLTTTAMAATLRSSSSATDFSLDIFSVSIPTTWIQQITFVVAVVSSLWFYNKKRKTCSPSNLESWQSSR